MHRNVSLERDKEQRTDSVPCARVAREIEVSDIYVYIYVYMFIYHISIYIYIYIYIHTYVSIYR